MRIFKTSFTLIVLLSFGELMSQKNSLIYEGTTYPIIKGIEEVFKNKTNHSASQLNFTDGEFYQTQVYLNGNINLINRARKATVWMYAHLYAPGNEGITSGTYQYQARKVDVNTPALKGIHCFKKGKIALDLNGNGKLDKKIEFFKINGGKIQLKKLEENYTLDFILTLENDKTITGNFTTYFDKL